MRILTAEAMREVDRRAIEEHGIPSLELMENAAAAAVDALVEHFPEAGRILIVCGPGNNGGDGLAMGRRLAGGGRRVVLALAFDEERLSGDAAVQLERCLEAGLVPRRLAAEAGGLQDLLAEVGRVDLVVDALFGTGLTRPLEGAVADHVRAINALGAPVLAVDLPSGLSGATAEVPGTCVEADLTVTFAAPKLPHILPPACDHVGDCVVAGIGIPEQVMEEAAGDLELLTLQELSETVPARPRAAHKGDFGHLLVVAGSTGHCGAALLAAKAAVRSGAGLVTLAVPASLLPTAEAASLETMTLALSETASGALSAGAAAQVREAVATRSALAIGPGLGRDPETVAAVQEIVAAVERPMVIDADGLNAFAGEAAALAKGPAPKVLTPHPMELARLLTVEKAEIVGDRQAAARRAAEATAAVVVLKGRLSLVADSGPLLAVNPTGNPGMATGGTGDVLTGMIGGLLAQGLGPSPAARLGVFLHGLAGDLAAERQGEISMSAGDLLEQVPAAFRSLDDG